MVSLHQLPHCQSMAAILWALAATATPLRADLRSSANTAVLAETMDGGGGTSTGSRFSNTGTVAPVVAGISEAGPTKVLHGFIAALTIAQINAYDGWTIARGLTPGINAGLFDDPNQDGIPNIRHFAFDTDPLAVTSRNTKRVFGQVEIDGSSYLTLTLPIRSDALFAGNPFLSTNIDGVVYQILGDQDLDEPWTIAITEVIPAHDAGLPSLGDYDGTPGNDWQYRTFRLTEPVSSSPHQFIRAGVEAAP